MKPLGSFPCWGKTVSLATASLRELGLAKGASLETILSTVPLRCEHFDAYCLRVYPVAPQTPWTSIWFAAEPTLFLGRISEINRMQWDAYGAVTVKQYWAPREFEFGPDCVFAFRLPEGSL
jgi:hypothetical protein